MEFGIGTPWEDSSTSEFEVFHCNSRAFGRFTPATGSTITSSLLSTFVSSVLKFTGRICFILEMPFRAIYARYRNGYLLAEWCRNEEAVHVWIGEGGGGLQVNRGCSMMSSITIHSGLPRTWTYGRVSWDSCFDSIQRLFRDEGCFDCHDRFYLWHNAENLRSQFSS